MTKVNLIALDVLMEAAFKKVAASKERKYFWNEKDEEVEQTRQNMMKTLCRLAAAKELDETITVGTDSYEVSQYSIPSKFDWLKNLLSYSGRVYVTPVQKRRKKWLSTSVRPNNWETMPGKVLSPGQLKTAFEMPAEHNPAWKNLGEMSKTVVQFSELHGAFIKDGDEAYQYYMFDSLQDELYAQMLGLVVEDTFAAFGSKYDVLTSQADLVDEMNSANSKNGKDE